MTKKIFSMLFMATALTAWWGCSSSDDDEAEGVQLNEDNTYIRQVEEAPGWVFNVPLPTEGVIEKTEWQELEWYPYEFSMTAIIHPDSLLYDHVCKEDSIAAVINGEVRDVASLMEDTDGSLVFMLYIPYAKDESTVDIHYYDASQKKVYVRKDAFGVDDDTVGSQEKFIFSPYNLSSLDVTLPDSIVTDRQDKLAILEGEVCYGVGTAVDQGGRQWNIMVRTLPDTKVTASLYYYSASKKAVYKSKQRIDLPQSVNQKIVF